MNHYKYEEVKTLIDNNINVLLQGPAGSGKSTLLAQVIKDLGYDMFSITMTRQTTQSNLLGFISVTGNYIPSQLRKAVEFGGVFILEELDATDPNVVLCLNTLENGYLAFPDGLVDVHENFRLCATANPSNEHHAYTGRSTLDASTLDRFDIVDIPRDEALELSIVGEEVVDKVTIMRTLLDKNNASHTVSMRDAIRYSKRLDLGIADKYHEVLLKDNYVCNTYLENIKVEEDKIPAPVKAQEECDTLDELWNSINDTSKSVNTASEQEKELDRALAVAAVTHCIRSGRTNKDYIIEEAGPTTEDPFREGYTAKNVNTNVIYYIDKEEIE